VKLNPAQEYLIRGYHCSESVLLAACQKLGVDDTLIPKIGTAFGGGMARTGEVCGAVVGAIMIISMQKGRSLPTESDAEAYALTKKLLKRFREEMGSIYCREMTDIDLNTESGLEQFRSSDVPVRVCVPAAGLAYQLAIDLLSESDTKAS